jgi:hypothetical protein
LYTKYNFVDLSRPILLDLGGVACLAVVAWRLL